MMFQFIREKRDVMSRCKTCILLLLPVAAVAAAFWLFFFKPYLPFILVPALAGVAVILLLWLGKEINALKKHNCFLAAQQQQFSKAVNTVGDGVIVTDKDSRIHYMNQAAENITGHRLQQVRNKPLISIYDTLNENNGKPVVSVAARVLQTGRPVSSENNTVIHNSRQEKVVITNSCTPLFDETGDICGSVLVFKDSTKTQLTEKKLKIREKENRDLIQYLPQAVYTCDENGFIRSYNKAAAVLWGREPVINREKWCGAKSLFYTDGTPVAHEDSPAALTIKKKKSFPATELLIQQPCGKLRHVQVNTSLLFNEIGILTGSVNTLVDITDKKQNEETARFNEDKYRTLVEQASEAIFITDSEGNLLESNGQACIITGYAKEELKNMNIARLFPKDDYENNFLVFKKVISGQKVSQELTALHKNKLPLTVYISAKVLSDGRVMAIVKDITELKQTEKSLLESEQLNTSILTSVTSQIAVINESGEVVTANKAWNSYREECGRTLLERTAVGENFITAIKCDAAAGDATAAIILEKIDAVRTQKIQRFEYEYSCCAGGKQRWFLARITPFAGNNSKVVLSHVDISEQKNAEKETVNYRFALDQTAIVEITDSNGIITYVNESFCSITGYPREEVVGKSHSILDSGYHTLDFHKNLWETISGGKVWNGEIKNRSKNGSYFWVNTTIVPCLNSDGNPVQYISIRQDISQRKDAEAKMHLAMERFQFLSHATSDTIWDWDIENDRMLYNEGICNILGYPKHEISNIRDWWTENIHKDDISHITGVIEEAFAKQQQQLQFEYRFRSANGTYKYIYDRAFVLYNSDGTAYRMIGAMQDITYKKEEEYRITKAIVDAQEAERQYLGMELHDNINQLLTGTVLMLGAVSHGPMKKEEIVKLAENCKLHLSTAVEEIRNLSHRLSPAAFTNSLQEECTLLVDEISRNSSFAASCQFNIIDEKRLGTELKICIYRILQEQLSNISKHAAARNVHISILQNHNNIILKIADDGVGFNPKAQNGGIGLGNIKKRTGYFSGRFTLSTAPGKGCCIEVEIPLLPLVPGN